MLDKIEDEVRRIKCRQASWSRGAFLEFETAVRIIDPVHEADYFYRQIIKADGLEFGTPEARPIRRAICKPFSDAGHTGKYKTLVIHSRDV